MKVLFVSVEASPFAKVGGLADVAGSLPKALRALGHDVRLFMPGFGMACAGGQWGFGKPKRLDIRVNHNWTEKAFLRETNHEGVPTYAIGSERFFSRINQSEDIYTSNLEAYLFFTAAVLQAVSEIGWVPDVVHCNDWHTGFIPVLMRERYEKAWDGVGSVFTIHNLAYQGEFDIDMLDNLDLPRDLFNFHQLEAHGRVNFLKSGASYADRVNTVSRRYANEIQTEEFGCRLDGLMRHLASKGRLSGILNGIDQQSFDPGTDPLLPAHYSVKDPAGKAKCKAALLSKLGLEPIEGAPLMSVVSRLSHQKGIDLIAECAKTLFAMPAQLIVLGTGEAGIADALAKLQKKYPKQFAFVNRFDLDLGSQVYAASDMFLMPSSFEPCGLGQMIALRYGTIPIVRSTGGLADTIIDGKNGFAFGERNVRQFLGAVRRACKVYAEPAKWNRLVKHGMGCDFSWSQSAKEYAELYSQALASRQESSLKTA